MLVQLLNYRKLNKAERKLLEQILDDSEGQ